MALVSGKVLDERGPSSTLDSARAGLRITCDDPAQLLQLYVRAGGQPIDA